MTKFLIIATLALWSVLFSYGQTGAVSPEADHYKTSEFDAAIFPASYFALVSQPRFTPTRQEIDKAETALRKNLRKLNSDRINQSSTPVIHKKLHKYKRQYFGYVNQDGQRVLLIDLLQFDNQQVMHFFNTASDMENSIFSKGKTPYCQNKQRLRIARVKTRSK